MSYIKKGLEELLFAVGMILVVGSAITYKAAVSPNRSSETPAISRERYMIQGDSLFPNKNYNFDKNVPNPKNF